MPTIQVDIGEAAKLFRQLGEERLPKALTRGVKGFLLRAKPMVVRATDMAPPANPARRGRGAVDTGNYRRRWKTELLTSDSLPAALISNDTPYAGVIEEGRRARKRPPPVDVLIPWVRRKLGVPYKKARSVAYLVSRAIGRRGLRARYVLTGRSMQFKLEKAFKEEVVRAVIDACKMRG